MNCCVIRHIIRVEESCLLYKRECLRYTSVGVSVGRKTGSGGKIGCQLGIYDMNRIGDIRGVDRRRQCHSHVTGGDQM